METKKQTNLKESLDEPGKKMNFLASGSTQVCTSDCGTWLYMVWLHVLLWHKTMMVKAMVMDSRAGPAPPVRTNRRKHKLGWTWSQSRILPGTNQCSRIKPMFCRNKKFFFWTEKSCPFYMVLFILITLLVTVWKMPTDATKLWK